MIKSLGERDVKMLIYLLPIYPIIRKMFVIDDDGTTKKGYEELVRQLKELEQKYPNLVFVDLLQGGNHDFDPELFGDLYHLNEAGATKLTQALEAIRQRNEGK